MSKDKKMKKDKKVKKDKKKKDKKEKKKDKSAVTTAPAPAPPQVVSFVDPWDDRAKGGRPRATATATEAAGSGSAGKLDVTQSDFHAMYKEVTALGATQFDRKGRKEWEAKKIEDLGGRNTHKIVMPYKMYVGVMKKRKIREAKKEEHLKESGVVTGQRKKKKEVKRRRRADDDVLTETRGRWRDGILHLNKKTLGK